MWLWSATVVVIAICVMACFFDLRERRIPNWLVLGAFAAGLAFRAVVGMEAFAGGLMAAGLAFGFGLFFYLLGGLGAGDVKLMAGLAAFLGLEGLLTGVAVMAATGVLMALVATARRGVLRRTFGNLFLIAATFGKDAFKGYRGEGPMAHLSRPGRDAVRSPYGLAVAAGALAGWFAPLQGWAL
jgi:prepilin peptidase CpaA